MGRDDGLIEPGFLRSPFNDTIIHLRRNLEIESEYRLFQLSERCGNVEARIFVRRGAQTALLQ